MNINIPLDPRLRPPDGTRQPPPPSHTSEGGTVYSDELRRQVLQMLFNYYDLREAPKLVALRAERVGSKFSIRPVTSAHCTAKVQGPALNSWLSIDAFFPRPLLPSAGRIYSMLINRSAHKVDGAVEYVLMQFNRS